MCNRIVFFLLYGCVSFVTAQSPWQVCPRPARGSVVPAPGDLYGTNGQLKVRLSFQGGKGADGVARYCYVDEQDGEAPTLRLHPGDELVLTLKNDLTPAESASTEHHHGGTGDCAGKPMTAASTNLHFHGLSVPPTCHQDEVIHTLIQPGEGFEYRLKIPTDQAPGLYWYHPHAHGYSEAQVLGGASGALIVEGIERVRPEVGGLPERVLVLRDQAVPGTTADADDARAKDISLNFVPITSPVSLPAVLPVRPLEREFWRVLNASADTFFDLQLLVRGDGEVSSVAQRMDLVALDGSPIVDDASEKRTNILLPSGGRAEFVVTTPPAGSFAQLVTRNYDTGPDGEKNPYRVIANVVSRPASPAAPSIIPASPQPSAGRRIEQLSGAAPHQRRKLYFSEDLSGGRQRYFITVEGETPKQFDMNFQTPDITVRQGAVEDWTIENRAHEAHSFHVHQLHFQVMARSGVKVDEPNLRDTIELPYWDGRAAYPSVTLRMDFRDPGIVGTFLYHCHILEHEDGGMMGSIQVLPQQAIGPIDNRPQVGNLPYIR
jgi:FtsP/CotA-like multicopper oxidase with cupredoxin domain